MPNRTNILTTSHVAHLCGVDSSSVLNWIKSGKLKSYQTIGKHYRILKNDLMLFIKENGLPFAGEEARPEESKKKILIVDDDVDFSKLLSKNLMKDVDWSVHSTQSIMEASLHVGSWKPDLIILDIHLPDMNGVDFLKFLKNNPTFRSTPIILMTGHHKTEDEKKRLHDLGLLAYFEKPFPVVDLVQKIRVFFDVNPSSKTLS